MLRTVILLVVSLNVLMLMTDSISAQTDGGASDAAAGRAYAAAVRMQNLETYDLARDAWNDFLLEFPRDPRRENAFYNLGVCSYKLNDFTSAANAFGQLNVLDTDFELADAACFYLGLSNYMLGVAGDASKYVEAGRAFERLADNFQRSEHLADAEFYSAECAYLSGEKELAAQRYAAWDRKHRNSPLRPDVLYAWGTTLGELDQAAEAEAVFDEFLSDYADHKKAAEVGARRGEALYRLERYDEALNYFSRASRDSSSPMADLAMLRKGETLVALDRLDQAAGTFASIPSSFPQTQYVHEAELQAGRTYFLLDNMPEARRWLTHAYQSGGQPRRESLHLIAQCLMRSQSQEDLERAATFAAGAANEVQDDPSLVALLLLDQADALYAIPARRAEAERLYQTLGTRFPNEGIAAQSMYKAVFSAFQRKSPDDVLTAAQLFLDTYGSHELASDVLYLAAEGEMLRKRPDSAENYLRQAIQKGANSPNIPLWKVRLAIAYNAQGKSEDVVDLLTPIIGEIQDASLRSEAQSLMGECLLAEDDPQGAVIWLESALSAELPPRAVDVTRFALAEAYLATDKPAEARRTLTTMLAESAESPLERSARFLLAETCVAMGDSAAAAQQYELIASRPGVEGAATPDALYELAGLQLQQPGQAGAEETLTRLLTEHPSHELAHAAFYHRGRIRFERQSYAEALTDLERAAPHLTSETEQAETYFAIGLSRIETQAYPEAVVAFRKVLSDYPRFPNKDKAQYQLAWALKLSGQDAEAARVFESLSRSGRDAAIVAEAKYHRGDAAFAQKDYATAITLLQAAMQGTESQTIARDAAWKKAWSHYHQDEIDEAIDAFRLQITMYPGYDAIDVDARFMLAECCFKQEKYDEALDAYENLQIETLSTDAYRRLALLHAGQAFAQQENWQESLTWLNRLTTQYQDSNETPQALYETAWAQQNLGETDEAIRLYTQVADNYQTEAAARARFMIGELQFENQEHAEAVRSFFEVLYGFDAPQWQANSAFEAARCLEVLQKPTQAAKLYQELLDNFPESEKVPAARRRLDELNQGN
jgi:cellulose synthase operon protein C